MNRYKKIQRFFPWALFLAMAAMLLLATCVRSYAEDDPYACYGSARYVAMSSSWPACAELCDRVREYLKNHTEDDGRAYAKEHHIPDFVVNRAKRCVQ